MLSTVLKLKKIPQLEKNFRNAYFNILFSLVLHLGLLLGKPDKHTTTITEVVFEKAPLPLKQIKRQTPPIFNNGLFKLSRPIGGAKTSPKPHISPGIQSPLQDEKFVYSSFYDRVRAQLDSVWQDDVRARVKRYYQDKHKPFPTTITRVLVTLSQEGELLDVHFVQQSQDDAIDRLALKAFKEAARFPHPPADLIKNGKIVFDWDFIIYN
jgi:TonB family protein